MSKKKFEHMLHYYNYLKKSTCNEEQNLKKLIDTQQQTAIINLQYPTKNKNFEALYSAISNHNTNMKKDMKKMSSISMIVENKIHLEKELKCLREITKLRNRANKYQKRKVYLDN